ncbi:site-specific integrase [Sphingomonas sp.]|uniref:tyrosine-type recombinase/integrase n=1 Tax=Sphingomonas sp. TaxID=28214 RepID=UPI0025F2FB25|nr:site-specific integrase [Sphingomonas sp.]
MVRWRVDEGYQQRPLGTADDELHEGTLDFTAAIKAARSVVSKARVEARSGVESPPINVATALETYIAARDARDAMRRGRPTHSDAHNRLRKYVIGRERSGKRSAIDPSPLASISLRDLDERHLDEWLDGLPISLKHTSRQRLTNDLKAALNEAYAANRSALPTMLPAIVKHGLRPRKRDEAPADDLARPNQLLSDEKVKLVLEAARQVDSEQGWEGDLFRLFAVLAATGARFSQVVRMRVGDVQEASLRLMVPVSRKGWGERRGTVPVAVGPDILSLLTPILNRPLAANLLERWRKRQVSGTIRWERASRGAWLTPAEIVRPWARIRQIAHLSEETVPYALRHSSIVRAIRQNLPIRLVASIHDTSVQMIERHYGRYIADGLDELAARAVVPLISSEPRPDLAN